MKQRRSPEAGASKPRVFMALVLLLAGTSLALRAILASGSGSTAAAALRLGLWWASKMRTFWIEAIK